MGSMWPHRFPEAQCSLAGHQALALPEESDLPGARVPARERGEPQGRCEAVGLQQCPPMHHPGPAWGLLAVPVAAVRGPASRSSGVGGTGPSRRGWRSAWRRAVSSARLPAWGGKELRAHLASIAPRGCRQPGANELPGKLRGLSECAPGLPAPGCGDAPGDGVSQAALGRAWRARPRCPGRRGFGPVPRGAAIPGRALRCAGPRPWRLAAVGHGALDSALWGRIFSTVCPCPAFSSRRTGERRARPGWAWGQACSGARAPLGLHQDPPATSPTRCCSGAPVPTPLHQVPILCPLCPPAHAPAPASPLPAALRLPPSPSRAGSHPRPPAPGRAPGWKRRRKFP